MPIEYFKSLINNWKENLYLLSLAFFLAAMPTSNGLIAAFAIASPFVWILTGDYKEKWHRLIHNRNALLMMSIPLLYLIGLCFTHNFSLGLQEINKSFYWFIFAVFLGTAPPISYKSSCRLLWIFIFFVLMSAGVALLKLLFLDTIQFSDFRAVTWVEHIPFSYQIAFAIWLIFYFIIYKKSSWIQKILLSILIVFLLIAFFALKSFTGYIYFGAMSLTALCLLIWRVKSSVLKITLAGLTTLLIIVPVFYVCLCVQKFYEITEYNPNEIELYTSNGKKYTHNFNDKTVENGNYVGLFICKEELLPLWNAHSQKQYDSKTSAGYPLSSVILRYMTSKGLRKDAAGFAQLSQQDIENIENEYPNYIYAGNKLAVYPRVYETIWELYQYKITKNPTEKTLAQRIEQASLSFSIIKKNIWVGIGTGNNAWAFDEVIAETHSKLSPQLTGSAHNQYLNYLIRFGILGTLYILGVLIYVFITGRKNSPFLITIFFVSMLTANFGEANWETFIGINFFAFFICFLTWVVPKENLK
jgi:hypothetical protein